MAKWGGLPSIVSALPNDVRNFLQRVRETLDGAMAGSNRFVTAKELVDGNVATTGPTGNLIGAVAPIDYSPPPAPTGVTATGALTTILIQWTDPAYSNLAYAEIWRSGTDNLGTAVKVGDSTSLMYPDPVDTQSSYYYWVRFISKADVAGPYNAISGVHGTTSADPTDLLAILASSITTSQLASSLSTPISLIEAAYTVPGSVNARIKAEQDARTSGDDALALAISSLSVSNDAGFDFDLIWYFDSSVESWTGNGTPTQTAGWLCAASQASDPYVISPSGLAIAAGSYPLVKANLRKVGTQTWDGRLYYQRTTDSTWDVARSLQIAEPTWAGGLAAVTWNMTSVWDGTIDKIRLDLSTSSDASNYIEFDWIAIGRGAPAASTAQVSAIETAKIGYCTIGSVPSDHTTRATCEAAGGTWNIGIPLASAVKQVAVNDGSGAVALEQRFVAQKATDDGLKAQWTLKTDVNGYVAGIGLANTGAVGGSMFNILADQFNMVVPGTAKSITSLTRSGSTATATSTAHGYVVGQVVTVIGANQTEYNGPVTITAKTTDTFSYSITGTPATPATGTIVARASSVPFVIGTVDGVATVVMSNTAIGDLTVSRGKIANLAVDNSKVNDLSVSKLTAGTIGAQQIYLGGASFLLDGSTKRLTISDGTYNRVQMGDLGGGAFGLVLRDASGNTFLNSGGVTSAPWSAIAGTGKPADNATVGAPSGTYVGATLAQTVESNAASGATAWGKFSGAGNTLPSGNVEFNYAASSSKGGSATNTVAVGSQSATAVQNATINFNARNDRSATAITAPTIAADGTAVDHAINADGSADISFEWAWTGADADIDGWIVYIRQAGTNAAYTFGTTPAEEQVFYVTAERRAFIIYGVAANKFYHLGIQAYRIVDPDVNAAGVIKSTLVKPGLAAENPYQPSTNVAFSGDVTGTIAGSAIGNYANSNISISASGALSGGGGGQVTIGGLGYTGALNATSDLTLNATGNCVLAGNNASKVGGAGSWDSSVYSVDKYTKGAYVTFTPGQVNADLVVGLNSDPTTDSNWTSLDYAVFCGVDGVLRYAESGAGAILNATYTTTDILSVTYDGYTVRYWQNGTLRRSVAAGADKVFSLDSSFYTPGASVKSLRFGPMGGQGGFASIQQLTSADSMALVGPDAIYSTHIVGLAADRIIAGALGVGRYIQSTNYVAGSAGWKVLADGSAEFRNVVVRGDVQATSLNAATGTFTGSLSAATGTFAGSLSAGVVDVNQLIGSTSQYTPGTYTITVPSNLGSTPSMRMTLTGGGGGGSGQSGAGSGYCEVYAGSGGGGGETKIVTLTGLTPGATYTLTVGTGGVGGLSDALGPFGDRGQGSPGGSGSATTCAGYTAAGGAGGTASWNGWDGNGVAVGGAAGGAGGGTGGSTVAGSLNAYGVGGSSVVAPYGKGGNGGPSNSYYGAHLNGAQAGADGHATIEFFNPNGVVIRSEWNTLTAALTRQGIQTT